MIDVTILPDDDLQSLLDAARAEYQRRWDLTEALKSTPTLADAYQTTVLNREPGDPWVQPLGAFDGYPPDWETTHNNKTWVSLLDANVWEPGVSGWREKPTGGMPPEWVQPTGASDYYSKGDEVTHQGQVWRSELDVNVYRPGEFGWTKTEGDN